MPLANGQENNVHLERILYTCMSKLKNIFWIYFGQWSDETVICIVIFVIYGSYV